MSETLTLPGDIPGLLRRGSPAIYQPSPRYQTSCLWRPGAEVVVLAIWQRGDALWVDVAYGYDVDSHPAICVALDLTDATGRAHAAWWAMGLPYGYIRPLRPIVSPLAGRRAVALYGDPQDAGWASAMVEGHPAGTIVPALAALDPDDPRRLSDGSRWVDAEALRLVCLHVAGRAP